MSQNDNMDRSLAVLASVMLGSSIVTAIALAALVAGDTLDGEQAAAECRRAAAGYLDSADEGTVTPSRHTALEHTCGGPHAFLAREVLDPLRGTTTCETAAAEYLRATRDGADAAEESRRRGTMAKTCEAD